MKAGDRNARLLAYKIAVLAKHGDVHIRNSDDYLEYLQLSNALARLIGPGDAFWLVTDKIGKLMEEPND